MSQIYLDGIFSSVYQTDTMPTEISNCDLIGITLWDISQAKSTIQYLLPKTNKLLVYLTEPTTNEFVNCVKNFSEENLTIFGNASINFTAPNYRAVPNWFLDHVNIYSSTAWGQHLLSKLEYNLNRPKKFDCLLGTKKDHRDIIEQLYNQSSVQDDFIFTYFKTNIKNGIWSHSVDHNTLTAEPVKIQLVKLHDISHVRISHILPVDIYNQSYYSIVAETVCSNEYSHYTEKTAKPIIAKRPFVMFSGQYFLRNLRSLGFKTFDKVLDEGYDTIEDINKRFAAAWSQVEWLCQQDPDKIMLELQDIVEYNYQHFMSTAWHQPLFDMVGCPGIEPGMSKTADLQSTASPLMLPTHIVKHTTS